MVGSGDELVFLAGEVAEVEHDDGSGGWGGVVGEVGVGLLDEVDAVEEAGVSDAGAGGLDGCGLDVEGEDFSVRSGELGEVESVVAVACGGVDEKVAGACDGVYPFVCEAGWSWWEVGVTRHGWRGSG